MSRTPRVDRYALLYRPLLGLKCQWKKNGKNFRVHSSLIVNKTVGKNTPELSKNPLPFPWDSVGIISTTKIKTMGGFVILQRLFTEELSNSWIFMRKKSRTWFIIHKPTNTHAATKTPHIAMHTITACHVYNMHASISTHTFTAYVCMDLKEYFCH